MWVHAIPRSSSFEGTSDSSACLLTASGNARIIGCKNTPFLCSPSSPPSFPPPKLSKQLLPVRKIRPLRPLHKRLLPQLRNLPPLRRGQRHQRQRPRPPLSWRSRPTRTESVTPLE